MTFRGLGDGLPVNQVGGLEFYPKKSYVFSPADIDGLQLWLKADAGTFQDSAKTTPAASDGDVIGAWADQSGQGNDATQGTTADKPLLKLNIVNTTRPVIRGDGINDNLTFTHLNLGANPAYTIIMAFKPLVVPPSFESVHGIRIDTANGLYATFTVGDFGGAGYKFGLANSLSWNAPRYNHTPDTSSFQIISQRHVGGNPKLVANYGLFLNGSSKSLVAAGSGFQSAAANTSNMFSYSNASGPLNCDIAELLLYDTALSTTDRQSVESYLNARYAIF